MIFLYRVIIQVVSNLPLTSKQKFRFSMCPMYVPRYYNITFVLMSMGVWNNVNGHPR